MVTVGMKKIDRIPDNNRPLVIRWFLINTKICYICYLEGVLVHVVNEAYIGETAESLTTYSKPSYLVNIWAI